MMVRETGKAIEDFAVSSSDLFDRIWLPGPSAFPIFAVMLVLVSEKCHLVDVEQGGA